MFLTSPVQRISSIPSRLTFMVILVPLPLALPPSSLLLFLVHFAIHQSIGHHPVSYNARRMDEAQPRWLGLPRDLGTDQVSCLPATAHRGTTQGFPSRVHHGILSSSHPGYGAHRWSKNHIS